MDLFKKLGAVMRRRGHDKDIRDSLAHYERFSGNRAGMKQAFSDAGTFRSQVDRLFALADDSDIQPLKKMAETTVMTTLTNRYYRAADYLSDILDDLERVTFLTGESLGEPALSTDLERHERETKLKAISEAWLVPLKVASIEASLSSYTGVIGRSLPYSALEDFERNVARLFAITEESERTLVEGKVRTFVSAWHEGEALRSRYSAPAAALADVVSFLSGESMPEGTEGLRRRRHDQPLRLSTLVPEDRQHYLRASFSYWDGNI